MTINYCCHIDLNMRLLLCCQKGSFHDNKNNEKWRNLLLSAITDSLCLHPPNQTCDACSLVFFPTWAHFMPGNFWTARCGYINKLLHPAKFASEKVKLDAYLRPLMDDGLLVANLFKDRTDTKGLGRYSAGMSCIMGFQLWNSRIVSDRTEDPTLSIVCHFCCTPFYCHRALARFFPLF